MADSETFISLEECRGHKRGKYQKKKGWGFFVPYVPLELNTVLVLRVTDFLRFWAFSL